MSDNLFKVILALIPVFGTIITAFIIPYLKEKIGSEKLSNYAGWAKKAVQCAEMLYTKEEWKEKKAYCVNFLTTQLKGALTADQIDVLIESAVIELKLAEKVVINNATE